MSDPSRISPQQFQQRLTTLGQLTAGVAHELNNPAGFILSNLASFGHYVSLLQRYVAVYQEIAEKGPSETTTDALAQLNQQGAVQDVLEDCQLLVADSLEGAKRMRSLLLELRRFAMPLQQEPERLELQPLLSSCLRLLKHELRDHQVQLELPSEPVMLYIVHTELQQLLLNLLINASQAMAERHGHIQLTVTFAEDWVHIAIDDNGPGIDASLQHSLFEPFVTTKAVGNGLGLAICRQIAEKAGGTLQLATSTLGGACFEIRLPHVKADAEMP